MGIFDIKQPKPYYDAFYATATVRKGMFKYLPQGQIKRFVRPVTAITGVDFESGTGSTRSTITRIAAGGILFGPVGAIVGGILKKAEGKHYVYVTFDDGHVVIIDGPTRDESKMRQFVRDLQSLAVTA